MRPKYGSAFRIRRRLSWALINWGVVAKSKSDCGDHNWYNADNNVERCHHCRSVSGSATRPTSISVAI